MLNKIYRSIYCYTACKWVFFVVLLSSEEMKYCDAAGPSPTIVAALTEQV